jgi:hypothetical protein
MSSNDRSLQLLGRHLIAICVTYRRHADSKESPTRFAPFAACIIDVRGQSFILTAGHIVGALIELFDEGINSVLSCVIADTFGDGVTDRHPIPFDFRSADKFFIDDDDIGLDFGLIRLKEYYVRLIRGNNVVPLDENAWKMSSDVKPDHHFVLGLPEDFVTNELKSGEEGSLASVLVRIRKLDPIEFSSTTEYPRFIGEAAATPLSTFRGMSGGPIFAFDSRKLDRYWIVAIQSSWLASRRIVFGCSLPVVGSLIYKWADEVLEASQRDQQLDSKD